MRSAFARRGRVVPEISDVADRLGAWVDGGEDAELDAAFGEWKVVENLP